ncbi:MULTISPECIES: hypothetical protein [Bacillus]|uniref:hypothetical protein n=1 Tax=Bacillus TaxID=1386 RepID=UPI00366BA9BC
MIKLFRVVFVFDNEHRKILSVATESKEELYKRITSSHSSWFEHYDKDKKVNSLILLDKVRSVSIKNEK